MALVRARVIFETGDIAARVDGIVRGTLLKPRDVEKTGREVASMRGRIERQFGTGCIWAIKQVPGGQVDVDFLAQYLVLAHAANHPEIISADARDVFRTAGKLGLVSEGDAEALDKAKALYRDLQTFLALTIEGDMTDEKVAGF